MAGALKDVQISDSCKWNENLVETGREERGGKIIENVEKTCLNLALVIIARQAQVAETSSRRWWNDTLMEIRCGNEKINVL